MKSFLKVLVVFFIFQSVTCYSEDVESNTIPVTTIAPLAAVASPTIRFLSHFKLDDDLIIAFYKIIQNCDEKNLTTIFEKMSLSDSSEAVTIDEKFEHLQKKCFDKETNSKMFDMFDEFSTFFKECIDPEYIKAVEKLHLALIHIKNAQCKVSKEVYTKLMQENPESDDFCLIDKMFQLASCTFEDKDVLRLSKNVTETVEFAKMLVLGNNFECGVANRYQKCIVKAFKNCKSFPKMVSHTIKTILDSFGCKINETIDSIQETESNLKPLTLTDFKSLKKKFTNATTKCEMNQFRTKLHYLKSELTPLRGEPLMKNYNSICKIPEEKVYILKFVDEIAEDLKKCIDTQYVEYVDKVMKPIKRALDIKCETIDQDLSIILEFYLKEENILCVKKNINPLLGCAFTSDYITEIVADSSKLTNFTMGLLGGEEKECNAFDQVQKCFVDTFDTCKDNSTSQVFKYFAGFAMNALECKIDIMQNSSLTKDNEVTMSTNEDTEVLSVTEDSEILPVTGSQIEMIRDFTFMNGNEAFGFMTRVALYAAQIGYYPHFTNEGSNLTIKLKSDDSDKQQEMAKFIDEISPK